MVVTRHNAVKRPFLFSFLLFALSALLCTPSYSAVLPEDRADILYHAYDGGGAEITGPSILVRKGFKDTVSVYGNYYVDHVSSASIDVLTSGSPYTEERTETSAGIDYLHDKTTLHAGITNSSENDYEAQTVSFGLSQEFFGDMTTLSMSYAQGDDTVRRNGDPEFEESLQRRRFGVSITQVLTRSWILSGNYEAVVDEGFLNNPYRSVSFLSGGQRLATPEVYPEKRSSDAFSLRSMYYLPHKAALRAEYRIFGDSWDVRAQNIELRYIHSLNDQWIFEGRTRFYDQSQANFYSDLFPTPFGNDQTFRARDKELSDFSSYGIGLGVTYTIDSEYLSFFQESTINFFWDYIDFNYRNFRNALLSRAGSNGEPAAFLPGEEPLYTLNASIFRIFLSFYY